MKRIIYLIIIMTFLFGCELRTPSKRRFENACDIKLPKKSIVIRDEYQDMLQDYSLYYTIKFDSLSQQNLTNSIRHSKYYDSEIYIQPHDLPFDIIDPNLKAIWIKSFDGYRFKNSNFQHSFSAIIDTTRQQAEFIESFD